MEWIGERKYLDESEIKNLRRRIPVEIAAGTPPYSGLFALCNDGSIWELMAGNQTWRRCADIPQDTEDGR